jgi:hypothetical protein
MSYRTFSRLRCDGHRFAGEALASAAGLNAVKVDHASGNTNAMASTLKTTWNATVPARSR